LSAVSEAIKATHETSNLSAVKYTYKVSNNATDEKAELPTFSKSFTGAYDATSKCTHLSARYITIVTTVYPASFCSQYKAVQTTTTSSFKATKSSTFKDTNIPAIKTTYLVTFNTVKYTTI